MGEDRRHQWRRLPVHGSGRHRAGSRPAGLLRSLAVEGGAWHQSDPAGPERLRFGFDRRRHPHRVQRRAQQRRGCDPQCVRDRPRGRKGRRRRRHGDRQRHNPCNKRQLGEVVRRLRVRSRHLACGLRHDRDQRGAERRARHHCQQQGDGDQSERLDHRWQCLGGCREHLYDQRHHRAVDHFRCPGRGRDLRVQYGRLRRRQHSVQGGRCAGRQPDRLHQSGLRRGLDHQQHRDRGRRAIGGRGVDGLDHRHPRQFGDQRRDRAGRQQRVEFWRRSRQQHGEQQRSRLHLGAARSAPLPSRSPPATTR